MDVAFTERIHADVQRLKAQREQLVAQLHAVAGAIQYAEALLVPEPPPSTEDK